MTDSLYRLMVATALTIIAFSIYSLSAALAGMVIERRIARVYDAPSPDDRVRRD